MTRDNTPPTNSVTQVSNAAAGYPEYYYWKNFYFLQNINSDNMAIFEPIKMYVSMSDPSMNYEHLFNLTNSEGGDPDSSSLFNVQTLKELIRMGEALPNIIKSQDETYGITFSPPDEFYDLS
jgi:hypothetical protein